jgi:hypothetical protein
MALASGGWTSRADLEPNRLAADADQNRLPADAELLLLPQQRKQLREQ